MFRYSIVTSIVCFSLLTICVAYFLFGPPTIPIWYSHALAKNQLSGKVFLFVFPLAASLITIIHGFTLRRSTALDLYEKRLILVATYIPLFLLCTGCIHILLVTL